MKQVLITGKNSYIGTSVEKWLLNEPNLYHVTTLDMREESWREHDFSKYDVVFHVAGIAHIKESKNNEYLYYLINRDLAFETAQKAKLQGVKQFIFLSTMSVYGMETGTINLYTETKPKTAYGKSKLQAEYLIRELEDDNFNIVILRPPIVFGKNSKGNYQKLAKIIRKIPIFPRINNVRSMIYIDNLSQLVKIVINEELTGLFLPQNNEYVNVSEMVKLIAQMNNKKIYLTSLFNPIINMLNVSLTNKLFKDLVYEPSISRSDLKYQIINFEESIRAIESKTISKIDKL